ncbi:MAG: hypothetical protein M0Q42_12245 [Xanthomonadales bacterium]|nr:hypothetical protein [Xanthomonadales bacterium]
MNAGHSPSSLFWSHGALAAVLFLSAAMVQAQTRIQAGYVHIDGRNDYGPDPDWAHNDWRSVDDGNGVALSLRHDWSHFYVVVEGQRLDLSNRHQRPMNICGGGGPGPDPGQCETFLREFAYDERYRSYDARFGWRHRAGERIAAWVELGAVHEDWSSSNRTWRFQDWPHEDALPLDRESASETSWIVGAGIDVDLFDATRLAIGVSYRDAGYYTAVRQLPAGQRGSSSLLEGSFRLMQGFGGPWQGHVEFRPSEKRQYWQAGIGYRF